jgi:hypothetical protein
MFHTYFTSVFYLMMRQEKPKHVAGYNSIEWQYIKTAGFLIDLFFYVIFISMGLNSSVIIATRYGMYGPEIETRWGRDFLNPPRPVLAPT